MRDGVGMRGCAGVLRKKRTGKSNRYKKSKGKVLRFSRPLLSLSGMVEHPRLIGAGRSILIVLSVALLFAVVAIAVVLSGLLLFGDFPAEETQ